MFIPSPNIDCISKVINDVLSSGPMTYFGVCEGARDNTTNISMTWDEGEYEVVVSNELLPHLINPGLYIQKLFNEQIDKENKRLLQESSIDPVSVGG